MNRSSLSPADMLGLDHRHLNIYLWTHGHAKRSNDSGYASEMSEMSVSTEIAEPPPMSEPSMLAAGQPFVSCCPPSTSFGNGLLDFNPLLLTLAQAQVPALRPPPPPYTPRPSHHTHSDLLRMHNAPLIVEPENDVDVVGDEEPERTAAEIRITLPHPNEIEVEEMEKNDEPLDLTVRRSPLCSPAARPSVITATGRNIVRSASSACSVNDDALDGHFKRSLSGKWPRRSRTDEEKGRASPMRRHVSFNSHVSVPLVSRIKQLNASPIEEHFRRALGGNFDDWMKRREKPAENEGIQLPNTENKTPVQRENLI